MADRLAGSRGWALVGAGAAVVALLTLARGPAALVAAAAIALLVAALGLTPLLRSDGIDWDWRPGGTDDPPVEPGVAGLRRMLAPDHDDDAAVTRLHTLVTALAADRAPLGPPADGPLREYLDAPPRRLSAAEVDAVITELESLSPRRSHP